MFEQCLIKSWSTHQPSFHIIYIGTKLSAFIKQYNDDK